VATQSDDSSPAWCRRLAGELHASDARAAALAKGLTVRQLNWSPRPGVWGVGQCLEHLCVANDVYLPPIQASLAGQPVIVVEEIAVTRFGRWFIRRYIEPSAETARARAPRKIAPGAMVDAAILDRFFAGNDETRLVIARAGHHDVNRIRFVNPFVPLLRFTVGTGLEIVTRHRRRHLLQAERIKELRDFPREDSL
jgi:hypothetical protein